MEEIAVFLKMGLIKLLIFIAIPLAIAYYGFWCLDSSSDQPPTLSDGWWGRDSQPPKDKDSADEPPVPFTVKVSNKTLKDLRSRLQNTRFPSSIEGTEFEYGFHSDYLRTVISYWKDTFNWEAQQAKLNAFPQFKVKVEGIDIHFVRVQPKQASSPSVKRRAIILIHGWPGSVWEFYKMIPLLNEQKPGDKASGEDSTIFEIICPSIPGYGFSEAPHKPGFDPSDAARVFVKLMKKLGHEKFYVQGGDWGSAIATFMAMAYPDNILGVHLNMAVPPIRSAGSLKYLARQLIGEIWPSLIYTPTELRIRPSQKQVFINLLRESGYMHIQATKPDTVAAGLNDSPAGLAAYILEKFSTWTDLSHIQCTDGCITKHYTLDEVLTNVMIYWLAGNIGSSMRFYKEYFTSTEAHQWDSVPIVVPTGIASFPNELFPHTRSIVQLKFHNIVHYTDFDRGGHFAAFEVPELFAEDIKAFVATVESLPLKSKDDQ